MRVIARNCVVASGLALLAAMPAAGQVTDEVPHASYYAGVQAFYGGEYKTAERELRRETQHGVRTTQSRWIDSICYHAMLGEVLYHEGRNAESLAEFDQACQLFLAYPNWLLQVRFQAGVSGLRADPTRARRAPPWGQSTRNFVIGQFPQTEAVLVGDMNANQAYQSGGVVREPMFWRVNVVEIMRSTALAIRRRNELLDPLGPQDAISKELSVVLGRRSLAPANHWTQTWIDLLHGLAQEGMGRLDEADALLGKSLVIEGQLDHPLTGVALLEQGRIAMAKGDTKKAAQMLAEASYSGFYFDDYGVVTDAATNGWTNHLASGATGLYTPLEGIAAWAQLNRLQHTAIKLRLDQVEGLLWQGQLQGAVAILEDAGRHMGEMRGCLPAVQQLYMQAVVHLMQGKAEAGGETMNKALAAQASVSLRNFQILRTSEMYDSRAASPRVAVDFYKALLADPSANDWVRDPLDAMAVLSTDQSAALDRWFVAALERKDAALALEIAERAKRRLYLAGQPFGGRLLALRAILESPPNSLSAEASQERQRILANFGDYQKLVDAGQKIHDQLVASPILASNASETKALNPQYDAWNRNAIERQQMLVQMAVRPLPTSLEFPPLLTTADIQKSLAKGETLIEFHVAAGNLYGFIVTATDAHIWQLPEAKRLKAGLSSFLKALGNYGANRQLSIAELKNDSWRDASKDADTAIFGDARLDLSKTTSLVIVPDDLLWFVPFEVLTPGGANTKKVLGDLFPIRYGPTAALAVARPQLLRRVQHTGIIANDLKFGGDESDRTALVQELASDLTGPIVLGENLPEPGNLISSLLDQLVVMDDFTANADIGEAPTLFPRSRGAGKDALNNWVMLPFGGPQQIVLTGVASEAEQGLKTSRRGGRHARTGSDVFDTLCDLMAGGARTILITRWRTNGRTNFDLVHEFARESSHSPAADAWQRACLLAREAPLDASREPRLKRSDEQVEMPTAEHPFFWAGYLLVDTEPRPEVEAAAAADGAKADGSKGDVAKPDAAKGDKLPPPDVPRAGDEKPNADARKQAGGDTAKKGDSSKDGTSSASADEKEQKKDAPKTESN